MARYFWKRRSKMSASSSTSSSSVVSGASSSQLHPLLGEPLHLTPEAVASLPPPGLSGPSQPVFAPDSSRYLAFISVQTATRGNNSTSAAAPTPATTALRPPTAIGLPGIYSPLTTTTTASPGSSSKKKQQQQQEASTTRTPFSGASTSTTERVLMCVDLEQVTARLQTCPTMNVTDRRCSPLLRWASAGGSNHGSSKSGKRRMEESTSTNNNPQVVSDPTRETSTSLSLEERLRRERQRLSSGGSSLTQFSWTWKTNNHATATSSSSSPPYNNKLLRLLVPARGSLYIQDGILDQNSSNNNPAARCIHDKSLTGIVAAGAAIDPQLSPDGSMVAWTCQGELYVKSADDTVYMPATRLSFGATSSSTAAASEYNRDSNNSSSTTNTCISHGVAEFVAQEEMDRYRGFWWHPASDAILFTRTDETNVPLYRIMHQDSGGSSSSSSSSEHHRHHHYAMHVPQTKSAGSSGTTSSSTTTSGSTTAYEDHRYPFAGKENPIVKLGLIPIDRASILARSRAAESRCDDDDDDDDDANNMQMGTAQEIAMDNWQNACRWIDPPREASEYLARIYWLPDSSVAAQWQNRKQNVSVLYRIDLERCKGRTLLLERCDVWINLHHMFQVLPRPIHPVECTGLYENSTSPIPPMPYPLPAGSFSFLFASERSGFSHLYLYTYVPGINGEQAVLLKPITSGDWVVEHIIGVDMEKDICYCTGTYDSVLERHLYAVPLLNSRVEQPPQDGEQPMSDGSGDGSASDQSSPNGVRRGLSKVMHVLSGKGSSSSGGSRQYKSQQERANAVPCLARPVRFTQENGMHSIVMDEHCRYFVDTSSDLARPTSVKVYALPTESPVFYPLKNTNTTTNNGMGTGRYHTRHSYSGGNSATPVRLLMTLYDALQDDLGLTSLLSEVGSAPSQTDRLSKALPPPELMSFPTADGTDILRAALYRPDSLRHGPGPYPLVCAVYGGPHVQRVNRSWSQSADLRAQRLRSLGFCVVKCDNRGSSRRGIAFESAIAGRLGRLEVLDQVAVVRQLVVRGICDGSRVGVYGWSYGGYLAAMCLCRAPDVFHVAVAGAPVTSWDGYDTHYTERYMGLPSENPAGYRESAVFDHVPNMQGKLMIVHGLIDENVHFRHTARLINKLIAAGKEYDLLIFPEERHSPRRLRDRIYMEQRISDYIVRHLGVNPSPDALDLLSSLGSGGLRSMAGHL